MANHYFLDFVSLGGVIGEKIENLALKSDFEAVLYFKLCCSGRAGSLIIFLSKQSELQG